MGSNHSPISKTQNMPYWSSITAATLSEAYLEVGNLQMAKTRAYQVMAFEEPHSMPYAVYTLGLVAKQASPI